MKDPAILLYIDKWLTATKLMPAHAKGWYLNLILVQHDRNGELPGDIEDLALICDVRHSEFHLFKQTWEQVLKQKFKHLPNGCFQNETAFEILGKREAFKDKRAMAGKIGVIIKAAKALGYTETQIIELKKQDLTNFLAENDTQVLKQMLEQMLQHLNKLYINVNVNKEEVKEKGVKGEKPLEEQNAYEPDQIAAKVEAWEKQALTDFRLHEMMQRANPKLKTEQHCKQLIAEFAARQTVGTEFYPIYQGFTRHLMNSEFFKKFDPNQTQPKSKIATAVDTAEEALKILSKQKFPKP